MAYVLDAHALMVYLEKESGYEKVQQVLTDAALHDRKLLLSTVNWGEVYYVTLRHYGSERTDQVARLVETFPIEIIDVDIAIAKQAALFKVAHRLSYADCFAAALAKARKAILMTGDKEFRSLDGEIKIAWL